MRLATFNVENLFERAKAMDLDTWKEGRKGKAHCTGFNLDNLSQSSAGWFSRSTRH
jgi:hypothetical protein